MAGLFITGIAAGNTCPFATELMAKAGIEAAEKDCEKYWKATGDDAVSCRVPAPPTGEVRQ